MKRILPGLFSLIIAFTLFPKFSFAKIGVGVGTGKIQVDQKLKPGIIYKLPTITVINTGDESSDYETSISYHQGQKELRPKGDWFIFSPSRFHLEPGKAQVVGITINLPLSTQPGDYFAYLEAHPTATVKKGSTSIGVAAASKLYFTILPANIFMGIYYKITSFWQVYSPWPQRFLILLVLVFLAILAKKFLNIQINLKKPGASNSSVGNASKSLSRLSRRERLMQKHDKLDV